MIKTKENDLRKILESSNTGVDGIQGVDSGPSLMFKNAEHYKGRGKEEAEKLGFDIDYLDFLDGLTLKKINSSTSIIIIAIAVHLGQIRLIDNIIVNEV